MLHVLTAEISQLFYRIQSTILTGRHLLRLRERQRVGQGGRRAGGGLPQRVPGTQHMEGARGAIPSEVSQFVRQQTSSYQRTLTTLIIIACRYLAVIERILVEEPMHVENFGGSAAIPMSRSRQEQNDNDMPHLGGTPT